MFPDSTNRKELARYLALSQVGMEMVAPALLGMVLDYYLDWSPWGVIVGAVLGVIGGLIHLVRLAQATNQDMPPRDNGNPSSGEQQSK